MQLHVLSDLHIEYAPYVPTRTYADLIIVAGDVAHGDSGAAWIRRHLSSTPVVYVIGNHEYCNTDASAVVPRIKNALSAPSHHVLENSAVRMGNLWILGCTLWTDFSLFDDKEKSIGIARACMPEFQSAAGVNAEGLLTPEETIRLHKHSRAWLWDQIAKERTVGGVVVTHHAPSKQSVVARFEIDALSPAFATELTEMVRQSRAAVWVHGHTHAALDYRIGQTRVVCNPRGYPGENTGFREEFMIQV